MFKKYSPSIVMQYKCHRTDDLIPGTTSIWTMEMQFRGLHSNLILWVSTLDART